MRKNSTRRPYPLLRDVGLNIDTPVSAEAPTQPHPPFSKGATSCVLDEGIGEGETRGGPKKWEAQAVRHVPLLPSPLTPSMPNANVANKHTDEETPTPATHATSGCMEPKPCTIGCSEVGGPALGKPIAAYGATTRHRKPHPEHGNHIEMRSQRHCPAERLGMSRPEQPRNRRMECRCRRHNDPAYRWRREGHVI